MTTEQTKLATNLIDTLLLTRLTESGGKVPEEKDRGSAEAATELIEKLGELATTETSAENTALHVKVDLMLTERKRLTSLVEQALALLSTNTESLAALLAEINAVPEPDPNEKDSPPVEVASVAFP